MLRVGDKPVRLLRQVRGLELTELPEAEQCCGFGGTFAVKNADTCTAMLADKMRHVLSTGAEVCTATDASCLLHIGGGLSRLRTGVRMVHLAEILASTEATETAERRGILKTGMITAAALTCPRFHACVTSLSGQPDAPARGNSHDLQQRNADHELQCRT